MLVAHALLALNQEIHSEKSDQFAIIKKMAARSILESIVPLILKIGTRSVHVGSLSEVKPRHFKLRLYIAKHCDHGEIVLGKIIITFTITLLNCTKYKYKYRFLNMCDWSRFK